jgi:hypothetical protein
MEIFQVASILVIILCFFADDKILFTKSEDNLQYSVRNLNNIVEEFSLEISTGKTKIKAFRRKEPVRSKICINNRILERVNTLDYLECNIPYEREKNFNMKITNFDKAVGITAQIFKPLLVARHTKIRIYTTLASQHHLTKLKHGQ